MDLLKPINKRATLMNTRKFLANDLNEYLTLSNDNRADLKSPNIDGQPKAPYYDSNDSRIIRIMEAQKIINCVSISIQNCLDSSRAPYKTILISYFIDGLNMIQVQDKLGLSASRTASLKSKALLEFAERFTTAQFLNQVSNPIKLIVYND